MGDPGRPTPPLYALQLWDPGEPDSLPLLIMLIRSGEGSSWAKAILGPSPDAPSFSLDLLVIPEVCKPGIGQGRTEAEEVADTIEIVMGRFKG